MVSAKETVEAKISSTPVVVYSKSYCPYCAKTKTLLTQLGAKYDVVELDQIAGGSEQQDALEQITGQSTVPNVFVGGKSIGGNSDRKHKKNKRRRVAEDDDEQNMSGSHAGEDTPVVPATSDRRVINTFSTGGVKKAKNVVQTRLIKSEREIVPQQYAGDATYETQIDTEKDRDARAVMERSIKANQDGSADADSGKVYRGQAAYKRYITKKESQIGMNKYTGTQGPIRAQTWARAISRFDYQPDVCKDYKETGFCGYGDSCKFLHDRGDYKSGWQIEKEYEEKEKKRQKRLQEGRESDDDEKTATKTKDEEQFACTICRGPFQNAVETTCGHFFCESCALKNFKKTSRCFNCKKQTNGVFNAAEKLRAKTGNCVPRTETKLKLCCEERCQVQCRCRGQYRRMDESRGIIVESLQPP
ncbi:Zinc finger, RING-type, conserved site [Phytophthora cactorum]|nr:Zinc finger, RING-type, conserved site [Phytophthora cactorum]